MDRYAELTAVDAAVFEKVWKVAVEIRETERHFNQLQHGYRALASTWLLGTFAGVGFIASDTTPHQSPASHVRHRTGRSRRHRAAMDR